jgi:hypothetical protein
VAQFAGRLQPEDETATTRGEEGPCWLLPLLSAHFFRSSHTAPSTPRIRGEIGRRLREVADWDHGQRI